MPPAHRKGDAGSAGGGNSPTIAAGGDPEVNINGRSAMRLGDEYTDGRVLAEGSFGVFINGKPAGRIRDGLTGGGVAVTGSPDVFIGEQMGNAGGGGQASPPVQEDCDPDTPA